MPTITRPFQLSIGLWILAGILTLLAMTVSGPLGGFSWVDVAARVLALAAAVQSGGAILQAAGKDAPATETAPAEPRSPLPTT
jgi:hypothetical protein